MENQYEKMSLMNLKEMAKEKGIKNISTLRKSEIIQLLTSLDLTQQEASNNMIAETELNQLSLETPKRKETKTKTTNKKMTKRENITPESKHIESKELVQLEETIKEKQNLELQNKLLLNAEKEQQQDVENHNNENEIPLNNQKKVEKNSDISDNENLKIEMANTDSTKSNTSLTKNESNKPEAQTEYKRQTNLIPSDMEQLNSGEIKEGILEVLPDGYGFIRCDNFLPGENDVYVSPAQIRRFNLKTGDIVVGNTRIRNQNEKFSALLFVKSVNGFHPAESMKRKKFEDLTPVFPNERIYLETKNTSIAMRMVDLIAPIGKGQRGMIVSQPKTGKTTLLKQVAKAVTKNYPEMNLIILLIDERPEEVTDIKESIEGKNVEVIYSTFDELPDNHKRVSEMVIERAKRLVEHKKDVIILLDSITRLARAYNLTVQASGRTLSGGLDPAALYMPKKFFGAARNMREGGSLTILATALVDTGSRMDDVVFEEFKGTGNMELVLDRSLSEKRIFPAIDLAKSSTRRDDLLLSSQEVEANKIIHRALAGMRSDEALEKIIDLFYHTDSNEELIEIIKKTKFN